MSKLKIVVFASGNGSNLQSLIDAMDSGLIQGSIEAVISDKNSAFALERAANHGIRPILIDKKAIGNKAEFDRQLMQYMDDIQPQLVILAGFISILPEELVKQYQGKIMNIHPALIPAFCGKGFYGEKVHQAVIEYGVKVSGVTVHFVDEGTDTGPIIIQQALDVLGNDTAETLGKRVLELEHQLIVKAASLYCAQKLKLEGRKVVIL